MITIFEDNFTDGIKSEWSVITGTWEHNPIFNALEVSSGLKNKIKVDIIPPYDILVECKITKLNTLENVYFDLLNRYSFDTNSGYSIAYVEVYSRLFDLALILFPWNNNSRGSGLVYKTWTELGLSGILDLEGKTIGIKCEGNVIKGYLDGIEILSVVDDTYSFGQTGLIANPSTETFVFDDFKIKKNEETGEIAMAIRKYRINPMTGRLDRVATPDELAGEYMEHVDFDTDADAIIDKAESVDDGEGNVSTASQVKSAVLHKDLKNNPHIVELTDFGVGTGITGDDITEDIYQSGYCEGLLSEPTITDGAGVTVQVTSVDVLIRSTADFSGGILVRKTVAQDTALVVVDNSLNYIYVDYNSGTPIYKATTSRSVINYSNTLLVSRVMMDSGNIGYQVEYGATALGLIKKNFGRVLSLRGVEGIEKESGFAISETGTRVVNIGSGIVWFGIKSISLDAIAQGATGVVSDLWYHATGGWTKTIAINYNNTQYDDGTELQTLLVNRYAVNWIFRNIETDEIDIVLGNGNYTLAQAVASTVPPLPDNVKYFYLLVGRIIVQKNSDTATAIETVQTESLSTTIVSEHNDLGGLQGGTANEYYHLTATEKTNTDDAITKKHSQNTDIALRTDKLTVDTEGNTTIVGELKIKIYEQDTEPDVGDQRLAMWIDTSTGGGTYLLFRRGTGDQISVELA